MYDILYSYNKVTLLYLLKSKSMYKWIFSLSFPPFLVMLFPEVGIKDKRVHVKESVNLPWSPA